MTAEGVETTSQADLLRREGCFEHQGYLISRPRPAGEVVGWLQNHATGAANPADRPLVRLAS